MITGRLNAAPSNIIRQPPSWDHWLVWIVYSAELGYRYTGEGSWQTFEQETRGWKTNGNRSRIREIYRRFASDFGGAVHSGDWADHFSIICWSITHAILPKDLQKQLARALYESRCRLTGDVLATPEALGDLIAVRSFGASSHFQHFAQEKSLVAQIAAALLFQGQSSADDLIFSATLERISHDLDKQRLSRDWLQSARRSANDRVNVDGLGSLRDSNAPNQFNQLAVAREEVARLDIEPRLVLRPIDAASESWDVVLEIPDLSHLLLRFPQTRDILSASRCVVAGTSGRPPARGRFLRRCQRVKLSKWPRPDEVLCASSAAFLKSTSSYGRNACFAPATLGCCGYRRTGWHTKSRI